MTGLFQLVKGLLNRAKAEGITPQLPPTRMPSVEKAPEPIKPVQNVDTKESHSEEPMFMGKKPLPEVQIEFKAESKDRLAKELEDLKKENPELAKILLALAQFTNDKFKKQIMLTMIYRTQAEQNYLYKDDPKYKAKPFKSPHRS